MENIIDSNVIKKLYAKSTDVLVRPIEIHGPNSISFSIFCVDGLVNSQMLDLTILKPIATEEGAKQCRNQMDLANYLLNQGGGYHAFGSFVTDFNQLNTMVMSGMAAILLDDIQAAVVYDVRTFDKRSVSEPTEESTLKGAKDSFIEVLRTNTALIRRRIRSPHLTIEQMYVGRLSRTDVALCYMNNVCNMNLVDKIRKKIQDIDIDNISAASFIEEFISENRTSLMPQVMYTERPDRCCSNITDGRIVLIVDGIPFAYVLPCQFPMLLQSSEDYSESFLAGSSLRFLRYLMVITSLLLPAFYIAVTTFHSQLLPLQMLLSIQKAKVNVPFSSCIEVLGMLLAFEILIEAGLRMPKNVGTAVSIVGGLVVGQAAVSANIISPVVVIIIAIAGIAGFTVPNQDLAIALRIARFGLAVLASFAGFYGLMIGFLFIVTHLCSLDNCGLAYMAPFVETIKADLQDTLLRYPIEDFKYRPEGIAPQNKRKQK